MPQGSQYDRSDDLKDKATEQFKKVADRVENLAGAASGQMREVSDAAGEVAGNIKGAVDKSVKGRPWPHWPPRPPSGSCSAHCGSHKRKGAAPCLKA